MWVLQQISLPYVQPIEAEHFETTADIYLAQLDLGPHRVHERPVFLWRLHQDVLSKSYNGQWRPRSTPKHMQKIALVPIRTRSKRENSSNTRIYGRNVQTHSSEMKFPIPCDFKARLYACGFWCDFTYKTCTSLPRTGFCRVTESGVSSNNVITFFPTHAMLREKHSCRVG